MPQPDAMGAYPIKGEDSWVRAVPTHDDGTPYSGDEDDPVPTTGDLWSVTTRAVGLDGEGTKYLRDDGRYAYPLDNS